MASEFQATITAALRQLLLPYQAKWLSDRSRYKIGCWARQAGKSFILALEATLQAITDGNNQLIVSASLRQALENMEKVKRHIEFLQRAIDIFAGRDKIQGFKLLAKGEKPTKMGATLSNGARIIVLPANPDTVRGFSGDIFWDEAAVTQHDREIWRAIFPIATRGKFRVRITSTPLGDLGVFCELWDKAKGSGRWTQHLVTLPDAIAQGLQVDHEAIKEGCDEETYEQEYLCRFLSDATSYFPWELLRAAVNNFPGWPSEKYVAPIYTGVDLGRTRDLTAIVDSLMLPGSHLHMKEREVMRKAPFDEQEARIDAAIQRAELVRCCIDATWNSSIAERARKKHGPIVEGVVFSAQSKEAMVLETKKRMERGSLSIEPGNRDLMADLHAIRKYVTTAGNVRFDATRDERGHADRAWAGMLSVLAAANKTGVWSCDLVGPDAPNPLKDFDKATSAAKQHGATPIQQVQQQAMQAAWADLWSSMGVDR